MATHEIEPAVSPWWILAILALTIFGLVGSALVSQWIAGAVNADAISIATNAAPAIEDLSNARGELVRIAIAGASALSTIGTVDEIEIATVAAAQSALRQDLRGYLKQPFYPREDVGYAEVDRCVRVLEAKDVELEAAVAAGDRPRASQIIKTALLPAVAGLDRAIAQVVRFNILQQRRLAFEIPRRRRHAHQIGYALQAVTAIFGLILMSLVIRGIRDYARLLARARAANRARDDLLATVSHDLRNPLNAIALTVRMLRRASPDAGIDGQAARIERATERMSRLIEGLLNAATIEGGALRVERKPEDAVNLIDSAVEMFRPIADEKAVRLAWRPPAARVVVSCDRHLVLRVLANIIGNAVKFSPQGGAITVQAEGLGTEVKFSVSDEGPGIPAEHRPHIFDRYWHQKKGNRPGTGLGLYIAKGIVEAHGGRIWIDDKGPGATVSFTLPFDRTGAGPAAANARDDGGGG